MEGMNQGLIQYEFEVEKEQRIMIDLKGYEIIEWKNHVIDIYDQSGRCRVRIKNGKPRLSIKVPLFSKDTSRVKSCIRLEFKPENHEQEKDLWLIRDLILKENGTQIIEKWGTPIRLTDASKVWINRDINGNHWIETDESEELEKHLPAGIVYLNHSKSGVKINCLKFLSLVENYNNLEFHLNENLENTSRTASGEIDTSVSIEKEKSDLEPSDVKKIVFCNQQTLIDFIWEEKERLIKKEEDVINIVSRIVYIVNNQLSIHPYKFRTWAVKYGRQVLPVNLEQEMKVFFRTLFTKVSEVEDEELSVAALCRWIEYELDNQIHPFADGCGRIAKAITAYFFIRYNHSLPYYGSRHDYYQAMNNGETCFKVYYGQAVKKSMKKY